MHELTTARPRITLVEYRKARITVTRGPSRGVVLDFGGREVRIGTAAENDLQVNDTTVSRFHCSVEPTPLGLRVRDEGSTNGVTCGGSVIYDAVITATPVVLGLGDTELTILPLESTFEKEVLDTTRFVSLIGQSQRMRELFADIERVADSNVSVLIEGETGTGKELVAEAVHEKSRRARGPLVVFDCSAIAANLVESELFGHVRGAFTGATEARTGLFQQANGGTLFLDELGELPKDIQPKLLRALEKREIRRLGSSQAVPVDVRLVAATNRNLGAEVARGNFREDLFFRLAGAHLCVPPLRSRMDDLPLLVEHFLASSEPPRRLEDVPPHVWAIFRSHRWPGNVRELKNAVQRFLLLPDRPLPSFPSVQASVDVQAKPADWRPLPLREARRLASDKFEREYLEAILKHTNRNVTRAAAVAEVSRQMIQKLVRRHDVGQAQDDEGYP